MTILYGNLIKPTLKMFQARSEYMDNLQAIYIQNNNEYMHSLQG